MFKFLSLLPQWFGDALLALMTKSDRVLPVVAIEHADFEQPVEVKRGWAICFCVQFYPTPTFRAKSADIGMSPGRKATLPGSCPITLN
jgi:hypothetical protein